MDNQLTYSSRFARAFDERHSRNGEPVSDGDVYLFPDGAWREWHVMGAAAEPSQDDYERLGYIVRYHTIRLKSAVKTFDDYRMSVRQSGCIGSEAQQALQHLQALKDNVSQCNEALERAKAELAQNPKWQAIEAARRSEADRRARVDAFKSQVDAIRI